MSLDINNIKAKDILIIDNVRHVVSEGYGQELLVSKEYTRYPSRKLSEVFDEIQKHIKYAPMIGYAGSNAYLLEYIKDYPSNNVIYLRMVGQDAFVRAISSVLMQGRVKQNDDVVTSGELGYFSVNPSGNKRKMQPLGEECIDVIVYNAPQTEGENFNVLIGRDEEEILNSFKVWLDTAQPMPYPEKYPNEIYAYLREKGEIVDLVSMNIVGKKIQSSVFDEDMEILKEAILHVSNNMGLIYPSENVEVSQSNECEGAFFDDWEVISSYSRKDAIEDGVLVDVTSLAQEVGIKYPTAIDETVYYMVENKPSHEDIEGRLWDIIRMLSCAMRGSIPSNRYKSGISEVVEYKLILNKPKTTRHQVTLKATFGPGDDMEPVITIEKA